MKKQNINHRLKNAKQVMFIGHMGQCYKEVKSRTLSGIMKEVGGFYAPARRNFAAVDTWNTFNYKSNLYEFAIQIID